MWKRDEEKITSFSTEFGKRAGCKKRGTGTHHAQLISQLFNLSAQIYILSCRLGEVLCDSAP
jgi:hypothetical protein